jgi:hypothetical protein
MAGPLSDVQAAAQLKAASAEGFVPLPSH